MEQATQIATQQQTGVAKQPKALDMLKSVLNAPSVQDQFKNALGAHKDTFVASLIDLYTGDKSLQTCKPNAVIAEALRAATLKLPLNKALGFAYIVVYNNNKKQDNGTWVKEPTPTFIPGYKSYIQLAMRTGQYRTINADKVYEGEISFPDKLRGEISFNGQRTSDKVIGYFCYFELLNGFSKTLYMSVEDIARFAKTYSPSVPQKTTVEDLVKLAGTPPSKKVGWEGNFDAMALKTVIRNLLSKYGYLSVEMQQAITSDINYESSTEKRDTIIEEEANKEVIDISAVSYEVVDTSTGEIKEPAVEGPNY